MKNLKPFFNLSTYLIFLSALFIAKGAYSSNLLQQNIPDKNNQAAQYLQCYPLHTDHKEECIKKLDKYVPSDYKAESEAYKQFVYDMERLGFANFLTSKYKKFLQYETKKFNIRLVKFRLDNGIRY